MSCQKFYQHGESGDLQHDDHGHGQDGTADFPVNEGEQQNQHGEGADDGQGHMGKPGGTREFIGHDTGVQRHRGSVKEDGQVDGQAAVNEHGRAEDPQQDAGADDIEGPVIGTKD